jgi:hypothetical protein
MAKAICQGKMIQVDVLHRLEKSDEQLFAVRELLCLPIFPARVAKKCFLFR